VSIAKAAGLAVYQVPVLLDIVAYFDKAAPLAGCASSIVRSAKAQLHCAGKLLKEDIDSAPATSVLRLPVVASNTDCLLAVVYPTAGKADPINRCSALRKELQSMLCLPVDRPMMRPLNAVPFHATQEENEDTQGGIGGPRLSNTHQGLPLSGVEDGKLHLVQGAYDYYHYMQDSFDDNHWGCAYRSLQTIVSWYRKQHYTSKLVPNHIEIQKCLVEAQDKPSSFIGTNQWIGSFEVSMVLDVWIDAPCNLITVQAGSELEDKGRELRKHFDEVGSPVMMGGGQYAYTCIGIDYNESLGQIKFLILDPHYTGRDDLKAIQPRWCGWKDVSFFDQDAFYNLCCPQRLNIV